ncbi:hypothetical protein CAPTEDRAFT_192427 [Capitella teleta]|uniref:Farnesoic acid O-methyl transferase domain-containing protein n=1 Tax=Capitella teleta TaxID=283909 RepID=R7VBV5_CAPTE|nr:hypothetical protein CAPTEDRAFT_192427 [Capitella teleta]|eukprot:ELU16318.1 hypothetical protein CAPTEDRAFT_192427 [Capitella teleta]
MRLTFDIGSGMRKRGSEPHKRLQIRVKNNRKSGNYKVCSPIPCYGHRRLLEEGIRTHGIVMVGTFPNLSPNEYLWDKLNSRELIQGCNNIAQGRQGLESQREIWSKIPLMCYWHTFCLGAKQAEMNVFLALVLALSPNFVISEEVQMCSMGGHQPDPFMSDLENHYPESNHFYFGVKACRDAMLRLNFQDSTFSLYFETRYNGVTLMPEIVKKHHDSLSGTTLWTSNMTLLDCDEMKYFWLKWIEGELSFGQGLQVDSGVLATIADSDVHAEYDTAKYSWLDMSTLSTGADFEKQCASLHAIREQQDEIIG